MRLKLDYPPEEYSGIIVLRPRSQQKSQLLLLIGLVVQRLASERVRQRLWIVDEVGIRIRGG